MALDASARQLRREAPPSERVLWQHLRGHRLAGLGFRRQHPIGPFVVDFARLSRLRAIELDAAVHDEQRDQDAGRTAILESYGRHMVRFTSVGIFSNISGVLASTHRVAESRPIAPGQTRRTASRGGLPSPKVGGGAGDGGLDGGTTLAFTAPRPGLEVGGEGGGHASSTGS